MTIPCALFFMVENFSINPYQYTWLNSFAKTNKIDKTFEVDYWGISNKNLQKKIITLCPGSRSSEIKTFMPIFVELIKEINFKYPDIFLFHFPVSFEHTKSVKNFLPSDISFLTSYAEDKKNFYIKKSILLFCLLISIPVLFYNLNVMNIQNRIIDTKNQIYPIDVGEKRFVFWSIQHQSFAQTSIEIFKKNKRLTIINC